MIRDPKHYVIKCSSDSPPTHSSHFLIDSTNGNSICPDAQTQVLESPLIPFLLSHKWSPLSESCGRCLNVHHIQLLTTSHHTFCKASQLGPLLHSFPPYRSFSREKANVISNENSIPLLHCLVSTGHTTALRVKAQVFALVHRVPPFQCQPVILLFAPATVLNHLTFTHALWLVQWWFHLAGKLWSLCNWLVIWISLECPFLIPLFVYLYNQSRVVCLLTFNRFNHWKLNLLRVRIQADLPATDCSGLRIMLGAQ